MTSAELTERRLPIDGLKAPAPRLDAAAAVGGGPHALVHTSPNAKLLVPSNHPPDIDLSGDVSGVLLVRVVSVPSAPLTLQPLAMLATAAAFLGHS